MSNKDDPQKVEEGSLLSESPSEEGDCSTSEPKIAIFNKLLNTLNNLQRKIDMATDEDASFKDSIKSLEQELAFQHTDIGSHINKTKNIIDHNIKRPEGNTEFDFQGRKLNELIAYRNYELSKYLRKEMELRRNSTLDDQLKEAQYQNGIEVLLSKIENTGSIGTISETKVSIENCKLVTNYLVKEKQNLQTKIKVLKENFTALENESSGMKLELETIQKTLKEMNRKSHANKSRSWRR
ncbi:hypothetical protein BD770DRAFT_410447 [Pilaira anomala]|nr:hypothetical protein BD770DRAFT_410447 [Pilaira anomala]